MNRVFFLTNHVCVGESGGGHGVEFRLYQADKKYNLFDKEVIYIFGDRVIRGHEETGAIKETKDMPKRSEFRLSLRKYIPSTFRLMKMKKMYNGIEEYLNNVDKIYHFSEDDVYIFHDVKMAKAFLSKYSFSKCALVYHKQGSIYNEWHADTGLNSNIMKKYYNDMFEFIVSKVKFLCFPSKGSEESLVASAPELKTAVNKVSRKYLYNGVFCPEIKQSELSPWIKEIQKFDGLKMVTVANLNEAKAVERIPEYIYNLKKAGLKVKWILVGNGVKATEVEKNIKDYNIEENVIWKKGNVMHSELMQVFSVTDFYILFHKYSIFDLSTLEAMHYGNIPVLTPVGGNKEMIFENSGLFVSDFGNVESFISYINNNSLEELHDLNCKIKRENFDEKAFLTRYVDLIAEMQGK